MTLAGVGVWLDYAAFLVDQQEEHPELISPESIRKVFERAVALAGLHYHEGHALWTAYADFEAEQGDVDKAHAVYQRALRVPMLKVEDVSESYSTWESAMGNADAANHVNRAKESLRRTLKERDARQPLESTLVPNSDTLDDLVNHTVHCIRPRRKTTIASSNSRPSRSLTIRSGFGCVFF